MHPLDLSNAASKHLGRAENIVATYRYSSPRPARTLRPRMKEWVDALAVDRLENIRVDAFGGLFGIRAAVQETGALEITRG